MPGPGDDADEQERGPPAKKRRTIADSIISTALSAALIGTAVGIAAYRVWRDRGKPAQQQQEAQLAPEHEEKQPPPPPYHPGDWVSVSQESQPQQAAHTLPKAARRTRRTHAAGHRRKTSHLHVPRHTPPPPAFAPGSHSPRLAPASEAGGVEPEFEDHVDWMSSQLARLIEQGKRALGQEVVLPSDAEDAGPAPVEEEDENAWIDDEQPSGSTSYNHYHASSPSSSYHYSSMRHGRTSPYLNTPPRSPLSASYPFAPPVPPSASSASLRTPVSARLATEDEPGLSPELREHMARARAARGLR
ncbi:hypothetical protein AURDEDRAFT_114534 [Auricularia subglabra TFB-10046 SS5]|nr:hypothetical protein AURDEDRAFT_114534 [Auricularia subglabra TFB-10046 SS5]